MSKEDPYISKLFELFNQNPKWNDCDSDCDYSQVKNGECECYNREMDEREEQAPC